MSLTPVPVGNDILVSTGDLRWSTIEALANGGFVVVWAANDDPSGEGVEFNIYGQLYSPEGTAVGSAFPVNTTTASQETYAAVATLADGGFVVIWSPLDDAGSPGDIYGQRYNADGSEAGGEFVVNTVTDGDQYYPSVIGLADGGFVVAWSSFDDGRPDQFWGVYGQRFTADGTTAGSEFHVNTTTTGNQYLPSVAALQDGSFVIIWSGGSSPITSPQDVFGQRYGADGNAIGNEFTVNSFTTGDQRYASATGLAGGGFVVTWSSNGQDGSGYGIYGQRYDAGGTAVGSEFKINTFTTGDQIYSSVTALADGGFMVTWSSNGQDGSSYGVYGQRFAADGTAAGSEFRVNQITVGSQLTETFYGSETVAALEDGSLVATWRGGGDIFVRLIDSPMLSITTPGQASVAENDTAVTQVAALHPDQNATLTFSILLPASGGAADGALFAIDSVDGTLSFLAAPDYEFATDAGLNNVYEVTVRVTDNHGLFDDQVVAITVTNVPGATIVGTEGADVISPISAPAGEPFATVEGDTIFGHGGNDTLDGGGGADTLDGGAGTDTVSYASASAGVTVRLDLGFGQDGVVFDTYTSIENATGSNFADVIVGKVGEANVLSGGSGDDTFIGEGIDSIDGGSGNDVLFGGQSFAGLNLNLATAHIETVWGSFVADIMDGSAATTNLTLIGQGLTGGANADTMTGGSGDDFIYFRAGDVINGGAGNDWAVATLSASSVTLNMKATGFENAWGSTSGDSITAAGSATAAVIVGDAGNDELTGGLGADFLYGFGDNDMLFGGAGGNDHLIGGTGTDTFWFGVGWGIDTVWDWENGTETFNLAGSGAAQFSDLTVTTVGTNAVVSFAGNQIWVINGAGLIDATDFAFLLA